jgi:predicted phage terminase large subunit-like protein
MRAPIFTEREAFFFMTNLQMIKKLQKIVKKNPSNYQAVEDLFEMLRIYESEDFEKVHLWNKDVRRITAQQVRAAGSNITLGEKFYNLNKKSLLFDAKIDFDAYLQYVEFDREPEKRFYLPRRKEILPIVQALQDLEDDKLDLLSISMPPGTGKTTLGIFFLTWIMGKYPMQPNIASAHSSMLTRSFYDGVLSIITDPEYLWADVFPNIKIAQTNSKEETIDLDKRKRFKTLTCRSIDGSLTGATRCERYLYADDLVSGIEEALSKDRLDNLWNKYTNDLKSRKKLGCKEIHIATRWSVHDVIGRLEQQYKDDPRAKFLAFPAINDEGESNFDYKYNVGFNTKYFLDMRDTLDDVSWKCLFMNEPIEREGLLFPEDELNFYNGVLPEGGLVRKYAACDVAWGGGDSLSMPIAYEYEDGSVYIPDVVFNKGDKTVTRPIVVGKLADHFPHQTEFEANNGGDEYCDAVDEELKKIGVRLNLSYRKAPSNQSKLSRIIQAAPDIKKFYFLDKKHRNKEYAAFMKELTSFLQTGKNKHDDAPDSLAILSKLINHRYGTVEVMKRPF